MMDEKEMERSLEAIRKSGEKAISSREESEKFLKRIGVMNEDGTIKPQYKGDDCSPRIQPTKT
jgi:hypothetical protein